MLATILGVLGELFDALIVLGIAILLWKWPREIRAQFHEKLRPTYGAAQDAACEQFRCSTGTDLAFCVAILAIAIVLSLSSGLLHFLVTVLVILSVVGVIWKWLHFKYLPFIQKLRFIARALWREPRNRVEREEVRHDSGEPQATESLSSVCREMSHLRPQRTRSS